MSFIYVSEFLKEWGTAHEEEKFEFSKLFRVEKMELSAEFRMVLMMDTLHKNPAGCLHEIKRIKGLAIPLKNTKPEAVTTP